MLENIRISIQGIWSHKLRSFLTMLGIIIGIAAIIAIVSTIQGTNEQIKENLIGSGNNAIEIRLYQGDQPYMTEYNGLPKDIHPVTDYTFNQILHSDHVVNASRYVSRDYYDGVYYNSTQLEGPKLFGIDSTYLATAGLKVIKGRGFRQSDFDNYMKVVLLDSTAAQVLFAGTDPINQTLELQGEPYVVIGVVDLKSENMPVINSINDYYTYVGDVSSTLYIPITTWPIINLYDEPENVLVRADSTDNMSEVGRNVANLLNSPAAPSAASAQDTDIVVDDEMVDEEMGAEPMIEEPGFGESVVDFSGEMPEDEDVPTDAIDMEGAELSSDFGSEMHSDFGSDIGSEPADVENTPDDGNQAANAITYKAVDLTEKAKNLQALSESTNKQLLWIASISLLVGGIGVMNIMLVSVTERTQEIGLKKAIGARKRTIQLQFLTEAAVLTSLGGIIGIICGIVMANVISRISSSPVAISVPAIIASVLFSMIIGIVFGLLPSIKAANLNPIDALRHE